MIYMKNYYVVYVYNNFNINIKFFVNQMYKFNKMFKFF